MPITSNPNNSRSYFFILFIFLSFMSKLYWINQFNFVFFTKNMLNILLLLYYYTLIIILYNKLEKHLLKILKFGIPYCYYNFNNSISINKPSKNNFFRPIYIITLLYIFWIAVISPHYKYNPNIGTIPEH
jgi:hypothetical protein